MRFEQRFLINEDLVEIPSSELLRGPAMEHDRFVRAASRPVHDDVPMVPSNRIIAGMRYPSSAEGQPEFYLPRYVARSVNGRRSLRLEMFPPSDDPAASAGRLTVELQALPMLSSEPVRAMPHEIALRLGYHIPVSEAAAPETPFELARFAGRWRNSDPDTEGVTTLDIAQADGNRLRIHAVVDQYADSEDLGTVKAEVREGLAMASFHTGDSTTTLTLSQHDGTLAVNELLDIHDSASPGDRLMRHVFHRDGEIDDKPLIWLDLAPVSETSRTVRRSVTPIPDMETYLRVYQVLTRPEHRARVEVEATATVGRRNIRQNFVGFRSDQALWERIGANAFHIDPPTARRIREEAASTAIDRPDAMIRPGIDIRIEHDAVNPSARADANPARPGATPRGGLAVDTMRLSAADVFAQPTVTRRHLDTRSHRFATNFPPTRPGRLSNTEPSAPADDTDDARARRLSVALNSSLMDRIAGHQLPRWVVVDDDGQPVLTRREETGIQFISPFWVDPAIHSDLIDAPEEAAGGLVLLRHEVRAGSDTAIFYQDGLVPSRIYYEPQEFRLARLETAPYPPAFLLHLNEEVDESASEDSDPAYSVTMTYQARPYIDPTLIDEARAQFGEDSHISPITPTVTILTIRLLSDTEEPDDEIARDDVEVDFVHGLHDSITFDETEYRRLTAAFQTASGIGLTGHVTATFPDGRSGHVPIRIGLRNTVGEVFNASLSSEDDDQGLVTATYVNRIESPVRIHAFPAVTLSEGAHAVPTGSPPQDPIEPGDAARVSYETESSGEQLMTAPRLDELSVLPDLAAILAQTIVVQGYATDTFDITVSIEPTFFDYTPDGAEPLTGVSVTFRTREEPVVLTRDQPSRPVTLQMPHILFLTNAAEAQHYSYSVQDLHASGTGAATPYRAGMGNLDVQPAMARDEGA